MSRAPARRYSLEDRELALRTLALAGNRYEAATALLNKNTTGNLQNLPKQTLWRWANEQYQDRYEEIRTEVSDQVAQRVANQAEEIALAAGALELQLMEDLAAKRHDLDAKDVAGALRNVTTTKSLNIDKVASPIRGRPTIIHADRSAEEIFRALKALEPNLIIDSTAEEEHEDPGSAASS